MTEYDIIFNDKPLWNAQTGEWVSAEAARATLLPLTYEVLPPASEPEKPSKRIDEMDLDDFRRGCAVVMKPKWMEY